MVIALKKYRLVWADLLAPATVSVVYSVRTVQEGSFAGDLGPERLSFFGEEAMFYFPVILY